jgi:hypothetical protein
VAKDAQRTAGRQVFERLTKALTRPELLGRGDPSARALSRGDVRGRGERPTRGGPDSGAEGDDMARKCPSRGLGAGGPPGGIPTAPLRPCRSGARPLDYPVRGAVRNPDHLPEPARGGTAGRPAAYASPPSRWSPSGAPPGHLVHRGADALRLQGVQSLLQHGHLVGYATGEDTIQLPFDKPLPKTLICRRSASMP